MWTTLLRNTTKGSHSSCNYVKAKSFQQSQLLLLAKILSSSSSLSKRSISFFLTDYLLCREDWSKNFMSISYRWDKEDANSSFTLCSRNFQNVKLKLDFVEIWSLYCHSDFTWNAILGNSNSPKMSFLAILEVLNCDF